MFSNLGTHVINNPAGTYSFVGSLPLELARIVPATKSDIMGQRTIKHNGETMSYRFPTFKTRQLAVDFAASKGITVK